MLRGIAWGAGLALATATLLASSEARACQYFAQLSSAVPAGAEHPVNAAVVLLGKLRLELVTATIDGVPVAIVLDTDLSMESTIYGGMYQILALRFEPAPVAGQTVAVDGVPCDHEPESCPPFHVEYVAVEPDEQIADGDGTVAFDLIRFGEPSFDTSCNEGGSVVQTRPELEPEVFADEAFALLEVRAFHAEAGLEDVLREPLTAHDFDMSHVFDETIVGPAFPLEGWCVELTVRDAAGNADVLGSNCDACMFADVEGYDWAPPVSPVAGGPCDDGTSTTTSTGGSDSGDDTSTGEPHEPTSDATSDSHPANEDGPEPLPDDDGSSSGPSIDGGVADRGCGCDASASPQGLAPLFAFVLFRRRARRAASGARRARE